MERLKELLIFGLAGFLAVFLFGLSQGRASAQSSCDIDCLNEKITNLTRRVGALEKQLRGTGGAATTTTGQARAAGGAKESFFQIGGGSATGTDWTKVDGSDFWFDQSLYGNVVSVSWQGWMENGSGQAALYDETNGRIVDGSIVTVSASGRASFYSAPLAIWRGQNKYYIVVKNPNVVPVTITTPRLRILSK